MGRRRRSLTGVDDDDGNAYKNSMQGNGTILVATYGSSHTLRATTAFFGSILILSRKQQAPLPIGLSAGRHMCRIVADAGVVDTRASSLLAKSR